MRRLPAFFLIQATLLATACERAPAPATVPEPAPPTPQRVAAPGAEARAAALRAAAGRYRMLRGRRDHDDYAWEYTAYFEGGQLRYLEAERPAGGASARDGYYFEDGALFYFSGLRPVSGAGGPAPWVPVRAEFRGALTLSAVRIEHYGEVPLAPAAVAAIRRAAAVLAAAARDEWNARVARSAAGPPIA